MKILIIRNFPSYMTVKNSTYNIQEIGLAKALVKKGHLCDIILWTDKSEETVTISVAGYDVIHIFYKHGKSILKNALYVGCEDLYNKYDILQPSEYNQIQSWWLTKKYPQKTIIYHGPYFSKFNKRYNLMCKVFDTFFLKNYIKQRTRFLTKSEIAKDFLMSKGINSNNIKSIGVGIDVEMLSNGKALEEKIYCQMKADKDNPKILYIGKFEKRRNVFFILNVFSKVLEQYKNAKLYMIGTGKDNYLKAVFNFAEDLDIKNNIVWQEKIEQKNLAKIYQMADFFLFPTEYEIFGMVLLEAMYYKTVVLTTLNGGSSMLIENKINGFVLENNDVDKWSSCIKEIYSNPSKMTLIKKNAFETISRKFTWDNLANFFIAEYKKLFKEIY